jgi:hypothetical protein
MGKHRTPGQIPQLYPCKNPVCDRTTPLSVRGYEVGLPGNIDSNRVHEVTEDFGGFTLLCSNCGHYTVVNRYRPPRQNA